MDLIDRLNDATGKKWGVDQYALNNGISLPWAKLMHLQDDLNLIYGMDTHIQGSQQNKLEVLRRMAELEGVKLIDGWDMPEPSEPLTALEFELLDLLYRVKNELMPMPILCRAAGLRNLALEAHRIIGANWDRISRQVNDEK